MRKVEVHSYNPQWPNMFKQEASLLRTIFGLEIVEIHHIGSTSVCGMQAKPIIDLMPVVKNIDKIEIFDPAMVSAGYSPKGENGICDRRFFQKGGDDRTHHVHIFEEGHLAIERHLAFRDYLRTYPDIAKKYGRRKEELAKHFPCDVGAYIDGKQALVTEVEKQALHWYKKT